MRHSTPTRAGARRRLEVLVELTLDASLSSTSRLILGGLIPQGGRPVVWPTDQELADLHGVSIRTVGTALADGVRAGWIWRGAWKELREAHPGLLPRASPRARRYIVLLWELPPEPAGICLQRPASPSARACNALQAPRPEPATPCKPLVCAGDSASSERTIEREERTFVPPPSPPITGDAAPRPPGGRRTTRDVYEALARVTAAAAAREASPGYVSPPDVTKFDPPPTLDGAKRARRLKVEEMVMGCLGPGSVAGLDALVLWLMTELGDAGNAITRASWTRSIPRILESADGFEWLVALIIAARKKPKPANWLSACLARGQPAGAQKLAPGSPTKVPPEPAKEPTRPMSNSTQRVNPCPL